MTASDARDRAEVRGLVEVVLRWAPPLLAAVVMTAALWVSAAAMSAVAADLGVAAPTGLVPAPPAWVTVVAVDGTILAATAVAVAVRRATGGWHRPALFAGGSALALSMALNVTHVLIGRAQLAPEALIALAVTFAGLFPVAAAVTLHLALDALAPAGATRDADRAHIAPSAADPARDDADPAADSADGRLQLGAGGSARARVRAVLDAHTAAGADPAALTGPAVAAAAGCSLRRAQELLAELRAPAPVPTAASNGHHHAELEETS